MNIVAMKSDGLTTSGSRKRSQRSSCSFMSGLTNSLCLTVTTQAADMNGNLRCSVTVCVRPAPQLGELVECQLPPNVGVHPSLPVLDKAKQIAVCKAVTDEHPQLARCR